MAKNLGLNEMEFLTPKEAAAILKVTPSTIIAMCKRGGFPNAKLVGKRWRIPRSDVVAPTKLESEELPREFDAESVFKLWE